MSIGDITILFIAIWSMMGFINVNLLSGPNIKNETLNKKMLVIIFFLGPVLHIIIVLKMINNIGGDN